MKKFISLCLLLFFYQITYAAQYQSHELKPLSAEQISAQNLSIDDIEKSLKGMNDAYQEASTERFLARHYLQKNNYKKAESYYLKALQGDGLSAYAKQDLWAELANVYLLQKNYPQLLKSLQNRQTIGGKEDAHLLLIKALAYYFTGQKSQAIQTAKQRLKLANRPDAAELKQLLFIFYNSGDYGQALAVQNRYLQLMPKDMTAWRQLANIYLKQKNYQKATNSLALAWQNQLPLTEADILQLAELYAFTGNPYAAGRLIDQAANNKNLQKTAAVLEKQYRYWLLAREYQSAILSLQQLSRLQPSIEHYLTLAKLNRQLQQWQAMKQHVLAACQMDLPDEWVGQSNLLLGISELKLKQFAAARSAFINATLIGGVIDEANAWLNYMQAQAIKSTENDAIKGPCTPSWARISAAQLRIASGTMQNPPPVVAYQIGISKSQTLVIADYTLAVQDMKEKLRPLAIKLGMSIVKNDGRIDGHMLFIFPEPVKPGAKTIHFQMAFPVSRAPEDMGERYRIIEDKNFKSASIEFNDQPENLVAAWTALYKQVLADGLKLTGTARQEILKAKQGKIKMQLQLGIQ